MPSENSLLLQGRVARLYLRLRRVADRRVAQRARQKGLSPKPEHLLTGERGEDLAYLYLLRMEVKTRTAYDLAPAASAVDAEKQRTLRRMALAYRRRLPAPWRDHIALRLDILSVYDLPRGPEFEHIRNAFPLLAHR